MRPFNIEEAKAGKPVCTPTGKPARIIFYDADDKEYPIVALVYINNREVAWHFANDGRCYHTYAICNKEDLMMVTVKCKGWINIYREPSGYAEAVLFEDEVTAKEQAGNTEDYVATIKIEWEE